MADNENRRKDFIEVMKNLYYSVQDMIGEVKSALAEHGRTIKEMRNDVHDIAIQCRHLNANYNALAQSVNRLEVDVNTYTLSNLPLNLKEGINEKYGDNNKEL